jgi:hypothetical protein
MNGRHARRFLTLLLAAGLVAAACGSSLKTVPTPPGTPAGSTAPPEPTSPPPSWSAIPAGSDELAVYDEIRAQVEELRRLPPAPAGEPVLLDESGVRDWMRKAYENVDHEALAAESRLFAHLGLLPAGASIEQLSLDLSAGQAIGFYDTDTKKLYLLSQSGGVGPMQRLTYSHEYTHAMQDQQFDLTKLGIEDTGQSDRSLARLALVEGDASLAMEQWMLAHMSTADVLTLLASGDLAAQQAQLDAAPAILSQTLAVFPYIDGLAFVRGQYAQGGWSTVDQMYASLPNSTSQILHPALYTQGFQPAMLVLSPVPDEAGPGWQIAYQDTMGELQLRVWLAGEKPTTSATMVAAEAVATWGGDRIGLYEGPDGAWAVVLRTIWRSAAGRTAFEEAVNHRLEGLKGVSSICSDGVQASVVIASSEKVLAAYQTCQPMD